MSLWSALKIVSEGKMILYKENYYTIINGRFALVFLNEDKDKFTSHFEVETPINKLGSLFDGFHPEKDNIFPKPESNEVFILIKSELYDFSELPEHSCPHCHINVTRANAIIRGKWAHCPHCHRQFFRAIPISRIREQKVPTLAEIQERKEGKQAQEIKTFEEMFDGSKKKTIKGGFKIMHLDKVLQ